MLTARLSKLDLGEVWVSDTDPSIRHRGTLPISSENGAKNLSVIYAELEPGFAVGEHTDSAEEVIYVLEGTLRVEMGKESCILEPGDMVLVPALAWHNPINIGDKAALFLGIFAHPEIESEFRHTIHPE